MRARSGAIHSETEEQFRQLAEASLSRTGIFYDEKMNRQAMLCLSNSCLHAKKMKQSQRQSGKQGKVMLNNPYLGFDFILESQIDKEQRRQLQRKSASPLQTYNFGIISSEPAEAVASLSTLLGLDLQGYRQTNGLDLLIWRKDTVIYKWWMFRREALEDNSTIYKVYLDHCSMIYDTDSSQDSPFAMDNHQPLLTTLD